MADKMVMSEKTYRTLTIAFTLPSPDMPDEDKIMDAVQAEDTECTIITVTYGYNAAFTTGQYFILLSDGATSGDIRRLKARIRKKLTDSKCKILDMNDPAVFEELPC